MMMKYGLILSILLLSSVFAQQQESVQVTIEGEKIAFVFQVLQDANPRFYQIFAESSDSSVLASRHEMVQADTPSCSTLHYLRAWLTAADNGVNGKKSIKFKPLNGAESEALSVYQIAQRYYTKLNCKHQSQASDDVCEICLQDGTPVEKPMCHDLKDLLELSLGINQEAASQSNTGIRGKGFY